MAAQRITLVSFFLLVVFGVPISQAVIDVTLEDQDRPQALELFDRLPSEAHLRSFEEDLEANSFFEQTVRPWFQLARYELLRDMGRKALRGVPGWYYYHPGVKYLTEPYFRQLHEPGDEAAAPEARDAVGAILELARDLRRRGVALVVVPIPGKASIHPERLVRSAVPSALLSRHTQRFRRELQRRGVAVVDLHRPFLSARQRGRQLYMASDTHWNGAGVELAAATIADWVKQQGWYRKRAQTERFRRETTQVIRRGDIPQMTQIPDQERLFSSETVACKRVFDRARNGPYEDDPGSPILLLGDSFSRIFQTDEPEGAGLIANLAFELQLPLSSIVNDGGASTLVRQQLASDLEQLKNKHLVIYAFVERDIRFGMRGWERIPLDP